MVYSYANKDPDGNFRWLSSSHLKLRPHSKPLGAAILNQHGTLVSTAAIKGASVKIFSTVDGTLVLKLKRGSTSSAIRHLCFSPNSGMLSLTSCDRQTVHVWRTGLESFANDGSTEVQASTESENRKSNLFQRMVQSIKLLSNHDSHMTWDVVPLEP